MIYSLRLFSFILLISSITLSQWIPQNSNTTQRLMTVYFLNDHLGWAGGNEGCILKTTDGGVNWNYYSIGTKYTVHKITFVDSLKGWAALYSFSPSTGGYIAATSDGGANWYYQYYIDGVTLHNIFFYDQYFGWAFGSSGTLLRTVDGGMNWQFMYPPTGEWFYGGYFINQNVGWLSNGYSGSLLKTTDGGFNWQYYSVPSFSRMMSIQFLNNNLGWAAGGNGHILKTIDGGNNWTLQSTGVYQELRDIKFVNENDGWAVGYGGIILHTTNGGFNWFLQNSNTSNDLFGLSTYNQNVGWAAGDQGLVLNTENGGGPPLPVELVSFNADYNSGNVNLSWITATELNNSGFDVERKSDIGDWNKINFIQGNGTTTETKHYLFLDDVKDLNSSKLFYRLKQIDFDGTFKYSNEIEVNISLPIRFQLEQNYPNPFNPVTTIKYQLPAKSPVTIKVFDILGKEVETLVNEEKDAGFYQLSFIASQLSSGIYFYTLQTGSNIVTKKMIILK